MGLHTSTQTRIKKKNSPSSSKGSLGGGAAHPHKPELKKKEFALSSFQGGSLGGGAAHIHTDPEFDPHPPRGGGGLGWWGGGGDSAGRLFYGDGGRERLWASLKSDLKSDIHCLNNHLTLIGGFFKKRYIIA